MGSHTRELSTNTLHSSNLEESSILISKMAKDRESHKSKKRPKDESSSDSDSGPDDPNPPPSKKDKSKDKSGPPMENGEPTWELGQNKKVKIREYKGKTYIDIREWYVDKKDMETKPGRDFSKHNSIPTTKVSY